MVKKVYYSNKELTDDVQELIRQVELAGDKPEIVGGFSRGGFFPAVMMSHYWNIPMIPLRFSTRDFAHKMLDTVVDEIGDRKFLVVDDICDSGETFDVFDRETNATRQAAAIASDTEYSDGLRNWDYAALIHNIGQDLFEPTYWAREINKAEDPVWIVFEYEEFWRPNLFTGFEG